MIAVAERRHFADKPVRHALDAAAVRPVVMGDHKNDALALGFGIESGHSSPFLATAPAASC